MKTPLKIIEHCLAWHVLLLFLGLAVVNTGAAAEDEAADVLRVITYNVQFLPGIASAANKRKEPHYRAERIAEEVSGFDIVALQETFHPRFRDIILDGLRKAWDGELNVVVSPQPEGRFNGGCLIATRLPIVESGAMIFENFSTPEEYGLRADGYAAKGVIHARIALTKDPQGETIDVFVTHLEARADDLRELQYPEFAAFVKAKSGVDRPALILGDLNTRGTPEYRSDAESQYTLLMSALSRGLGRELTDVWPALMGDANGGTSEQESEEIGRRIDYILVSNPNPAGLQLKPLSIRVNLYRDPQVVALSDHNAVEAELEWGTVERSQQQRSKPKP